MNKIFLSALLLLALLQNALAQSGKTIEFRNGLWFNGKDFTEGTWYVRDGLLTRKAPAKIDTVVDLEKRWVVPPLADAHVSCLAGNPSAKEALKAYASEGVFYLQILSNTQQERQDLANLLNKPGTPDALFANGGLTCSLGTPFLKYEPRAWDIHTPDQVKARYEQIRLNRKMLGDGYWFIDSKDDVSKNWDKIKAQKPGVLSIYLLDADKNGGKEGKGLTADAAKAIIKKAKKADLQVFAHVETVDDVRLGIKLGVNGFANLPGSNWDGTGDPARFELKPDDLKKLVKKNIAVVPLLSHGQAAAVSNPAVLEFHKKTLKALLAEGVPVAIGSDDGSRTMRTELNYWLQIGAITTPEAMRILCETTPRAIFPERKIGKLEEGYEASFLALNDNPLGNIMKIRLISFKVKNGLIVK